jgi:hypothetical protein
MNVNYCSGFGVKHTDKHKPFSTITWSQITELVDCPQDIDKALGQWIIPSTLVSRLRRDQEKGGEYWMLWADIDDKPPVLDELSKFLSVFLDGSRFEVYTTKSATESIQKTRVLIPLNEPLTPQQWKECQQVLNDELEVNLVPPDRCSEKLQQLVLLPNKGDFYGSRSQRTGSYFSPLEAFSDAITTRKPTPSQPKTASKAMLDFNASIPAANEASGYGMKALESECLAIARAPEGARNSGLNAACFNIGSLVAGGEINEAYALNCLWQSAQQSGLPVGEIEKTLTSGFQAGKRNPRSAPKADGNSIDITKLIEAKPVLSALEQLSAYAMNGRSVEMRQQMLDDKYVLDRIAILGQWTTFYAAPNTGKTLLTIWMLVQQVKAGEIEGSKIHYVNADDHYKGSVEKLELLEPHKINVLIPNQNNFDTDKLTRLIGQLTKDNEAMGQVIILDTLKKFTDLMDKKAATAFGKLARSFVGAGGTIITLAHTNKNRNDEGKRVFVGTSDILDDCDCSYVIDGGGPDGHNKYRAIFDNNKARGDVAQKVAFQYSKLDGCTYEQLLNSIVRLGKKEAKAADKENQLRKDIRVDKTTVDAILEALGDGELSTQAILSHVTEETPIGRRPAKNALIKWTGEDYDQGHRWTFRRGEKNEKLYTRLSNPIDETINSLIARLDV